VTDGQPEDEQSHDRSYEERPGRHVTINQIVAYNMAHFRKAAGITQAELGERLGWSFRAVSAAERTWDRTDGKGRIFDADLIVSLSHALQLPIIAFFLPPDEAGTEGRHLFHPASKSPPLGGSDCLTMQDLAYMVMPGNDDPDITMSTYRSRLTLVVATYLEPGWSEMVDRWLTEETEAELLAEGLKRIRWEQEALRAVIGDLEKFAGALDHARSRKD